MKTVKIFVGKFFKWKIRKKIWLENSEKFSIENWEKFLIENSENLIENWKVFNWKIQKKNYWKIQKNLKWKINKIFLIFHKISQLTFQLPHPALDPQTQSIITIEYPIKGIDTFFGLICISHILFYRW